MRTIPRKEDLIIIGKADVQKLSIIFYSVCIMFCLIGCSGKNSGPKPYDDFEAFNAESAYDFYLPDGAEDLKMAFDNRTFSKAHFYSYVLDDKELEDLINKTVEEKYTRTDDDGNEIIEYDKYYGIQVKDIDSLDSYESDNFNHTLGYDSVIDDSVEDYYVIYYYPILIGSHSEGILYNPETNRVLVYSYSAIK